MDNDLAKKKKPNDGSDEDNKGYSDSLQDEKNDFGMREYGYDLESKEKEEDEQKENDEDDGEYLDEEEKKAKSREEDEGYRKRLDELEQLRKMREEKRKKDLGITKDREKKREEEEKKKEKQWEDSDETEKKKNKLIAGEKVERKRTFTHKKEEGVFRHKKLFNFNTKGLEKINKRFKKVHGISSKKKRKFLKLLEAYNPSKSLMTRAGFNDFSRRFKSKRFTGPNFNRMKKDGINLRTARKEFGKRDLNELRRCVTGEKDSHKYQSKSLSRKNSDLKSSGSGITAKMR